MKVSCPNCKKPINVSSKYTGDKEVCPHCFAPVKLNPTRTITSDMLKWKDAFAQKGDKKDDKAGK